MTMPTPQAATLPDSVLSETAAPTVDHFNVAGKPTLRGCFAHITPRANKTQFGDFETAAGWASNFKALNQYGLDAQIDCFCCETSALTEALAATNPVRVLPLIDTALLHETMLPAQCVGQVVAAIEQYVAMAKAAEASGGKPALSTDGRIAIKLYGDMYAAWDDVIAGIASIRDDLFIIAPIPGSPASWSEASWEVPAAAGMPKSPVDAWYTFFPFPPKQSAAMLALAKGMPLIPSLMPWYPLRSAQGLKLDWPVDGGERFARQIADIKAVNCRSATIWTWNEITIGDGDGIADDDALLTMAAQFAH